MKSLLIALTLIAISCCQALCQDPGTITSKVDAYLKSANTTYHFNGAALVLQGNEVVLNGGYGLSNMDLKSPNTSATRFPILSITKTFTSTIILKLQEEKKLSVDDKITKYFPDCPQWSGVTIQHLLTHSSGIYSYTNDVDVEDSALVNHPIPKEKLVGYFKNKKLDFTPGKYYSYNNSGYFLLGLVIEKVTGKPYEEVVREIIFKPLGMSDSGFDFNHLPVSMKAQGYQFWDKDKAVAYKHYDSTFAYSAGSIYSTTEDMLKWAEAVSTEKILMPATWASAFKPRIQNYGLGWQTGQFFGRKYVKHSGGYPGFMSEFVYFPDEKLVIFLLNNFGTYDQNVWSVAMGISCIMFSLPYDEWKLRDKVDVDRSILKQHSGTYFSGKARIEIKLMDNKLYAKVAGEDLRLYAENENKFYFRDFNTTLAFNDGNLTIHEHGKDSNWTKKK